MSYMAVLRLKGGTQHSNQVEVELGDGTVGMVASQIKGLDRVVGGNQDRDEQNEGLDGEGAATHFQRAHSTVTQLRGLVQTPEPGLEM
jgi:hypothetical protein